MFKLNPERMPESKFHKAYAFDIDENLLHTNCTVFVERWNGSKLETCEIPETELKAKLEEGRIYPDNDPEECFRNMRLGNEKLTQDLFDALAAGAYGPAWERFKLANLQASPIGIITARGHPIEDLKAAHRAILHEVFTTEEKEQFLEQMKLRLGDYRASEDHLIHDFFDMNYYAACANRTYSDSLNLPFDTPSPKKKVFAFNKFIEHIVKLNQEKLMNPYHKALKIWFSDDSLENLSAIEEAVQNRFVLSYPEITFALYNTNNPDFVKKTLYASKQNQEPEF